MATKANPKAGLHGLYYYYHTMAKTLSVYGQPIITDGRGVKHHWARELATHLASIQKPEGYWVNDSDRFWENLPTLNTAYALIALSICKEELARESQAAAVKSGSGSGK
jgi:squalene-hopene/tetraprenyl-beta-curcumene cyclase